MLRSLIALSLLPLAAQSAEFLDPHQAFLVGARGASPGAVELVFDIRPGHYMYREAFRVQTVAGNAVVLDAMPTGQRKFDEAFQREMEIHRGTLRVPLALGEATSELRVTGQGCADKGLCYAPMTSRLVAGVGGVWTLLPGADPAGEFGPAALSRLQPVQVAATGTPTRPEALVALTVGIWALLMAARRF